MVDRLGAEPEEAGTGADTATHTDMKWNMMPIACTCEIERERHAFYDLSDQAATGFVSSLLAIICDGTSIEVPLRSGARGPGVQTRGLSGSGEVSAPGPTQQS
jgi:hypothetical protein